MSTSSSTGVPARIRPVFVDPSAAVPSWVASRMAEVQACLIHDLSLAAIAMCRATRHLRKIVVRLYSPT